MFYLASKSEFLRSFTDSARWQVQINLINDLTQVPLHVCNDDSLSKLLSISLIATIMFDLDVKV